MLKSNKKTQGEKEKMYYVYILKAVRTSKKNLGKVIYYTGLTNNPKRRLQEHHWKARSNFMSKYKIMPICFVYLEQFSNYYLADKRKYQIKNFSLAKKIELIKTYLSDSN